LRENHKSGKIEYFAYVVFFAEASNTQKLKRPANENATRTVAFSGHLWTLKKVIKLFHSIQSKTPMAA
jgi:hypothetical protein